MVATFALQQHPQAAASTSQRCQQPVQQLRAPLCRPSRPAPRSRRAMSATAVASPAVEKVALRTYRADQLSPEELKRVLARPRIDFTSILNVVRRRDGTLGGGGVGIDRRRSMWEARRLGGVPYLARGGAPPPMRVGAGGEQGCTRAPCTCGFCHARGGLPMAVDAAGRAPGRQGG